MQRSGSNSKARMIKYQAIHRLSFRCEAKRSDATRSGALSSACLIPPSWWLIWVRCLPCCLPRRLLSSYLAKSSRGNPRQQLYLLIKQPHPLLDIDSLFRRLLLPSLP
mmetsp:Transcript_20632/g.40522  ORF Transcript_20632/g.40522 Transcript_20632/m.40522 type:complete len:108 (+) Transcript_20632:821-1144(+)